MADEKIKQEKKEDKEKEKVETKPEEKKASGEKQDKKDEKKKPEVKKVEIKPKDCAVVRGHSMRLSLKHCIAICKMLKGKTPENAVEFLDGVALGKNPVHMRGREVPHQKGKGVAGAKYPKKAALEMIDLIKQLGANANVNQIEEPVIVIAKADTSSRPWRRDRRKAKRCHVYLEVRTKIKKAKKEVKEEKK